MKRILVTILLGILLFAQIQAQDLNGFANDFEALITGVTRDIAPNLQMTALSGNIAGDATIDHFMFFFPAMGVTVSDGLGTILESGVYNWEFLLPLPGIINTIVGDDTAVRDNIHAVETRFFPYPTMKTGFGFGLGRGFDIIVSGMYIPSSITKTLLKQAGGDIAALGVSFDTYTFGAEVRKTIFHDTKKTPAFSLGGLYNFAGLNLEVSNMSLSALNPGGIDVSGQPLDMSGEISFNTAVHNFGFDVHVSKHLLFFTPFAKLTGVYQYAVTKSNVDLEATIGDPVSSRVNIRTSPTVAISNFSTLATLGFDLNLFIFIFNTNAVFDLARAELDISDFSLTGITGRGVTLNMGFRWQF